MCIRDSHQVGIKDRPDGITMQILQVIPLHERLGAQFPVHLALDRQAPIMMEGREIIAGDVMFQRRQMLVHINCRAPAGADKDQTMFFRRRYTRTPVSYTHLRAHETVLDLVCRLLLEKKKKNTYK
eukprot:TRINITY_DN1337_c0_g1_i1.p1 TRINITY_DN1337_c0_g1~~TRINITY_DN1337_c0_g1_i1.p1  ORF type:complete len:126 (-),score=35.92 TRINITY_DN1337_c0_g1_i1:72-449(-)